METVEVQMNNAELLREFGDWAPERVQVPEGHLVRRCGDDLSYTLIPGAEWWAPCGSETRSGRTEYYESVHAGSITSIGGTPWQDSFERDTPWGGTLTRVMAPAR